MQQQCIERRATPGIRGLGSDRLNGPLHPLEGVVYAQPERATYYLNAGVWERRTLGDALRSAAKDAPNRTAFVCEGHRMSFGELDATSERLALGLRALGLQVHDRAMFQ